MNAAHTIAVAVLLCLLIQAGVSQEGAVTGPRQPASGATTPPPIPPAVRQARSRAFNGGRGVKALVDQPVGHHPVIHVEYGRPDPMPFKPHGTVVLGTIDGKQCFLSDDGSAVYTEYLLSVQEVLFDRRRSVSPGSMLAVVLHGGTVTLPNERVLATIARPEVRLEPGKRYVLFLREINATGAFLLDKPWPIVNGYVASSKTDGDDFTFTGLDESRFIDSVRNAARIAARNFDSKDRGMLQ